MIKMKMEYNECKICGANNSRAGLLIGNAVEGLVHACLNCHDTRTNNEITIHSRLQRTTEELRRTFNIIKPSIN